MLSTLLLFLAATALGIQPPTAEEALVPGIIESGGRTKDVLSAPTDVRVGEEFEIKITTFGGGCEREGPTSVVISAAGATVMVYDITSATHPGVVCIAVVKRLPHSVILRFDKPGEATIRVWGRRIGADTPPVGVPTVLEHRVTIK